MAGPVFDASKLKSHSFSRISQFVGSMFSILFEKQLQFTQVKIRLHKISIPPLLSFLLPSQLANSPTLNVMSRILIFQIAQGVLSILSKLAVSDCCPTELKSNKQAPNMQQLTYLSLSLPLSSLTIKLNLPSSLQPTRLGK